MDDYQEPIDIQSFSRKLEVAWKCIPDARFHEMLDAVFNGYDLEEITNEEMGQLLEEFILQNQ